MKSAINGYFYSGNTFINLPIIGSSPFAGPTGDEEEIVSYELAQNYPNPFNPTTNIRFTLPTGFNGLVTLKIYDITGKEVSTLINQKMDSGQHSVQWNASNLSSGAYFYKIQAGSFTNVKKMMLVK